MFKPFVKVSYDRRDDFKKNASSETYKNSIIFLDGNADEGVPSEIWVGNYKYANYTTASNTGLTEDRVRAIFTEMIKQNIDKNSNGAPDWEDYVKTSGDNGAWGDYNA